MDPSCFLEVFKKYRACLFYSSFITYLESSQFALVKVCLKLGIIIFYMQLHMIVRLMKGVHFQVWSFID